MAWALVPASLSLDSQLCGNKTTLELQGGSFLGCPWGHAALGVPCVSCEAVQGRSTGRGLAAGWSCSVTDFYALFFFYLSPIYPPLIIYLSIHPPACSPSNPTCVCCEKLKR